MTRVLPSIVLVGLLFMFAIRSRCAEHDGESLPNSGSRQESKNPAADETKSDSYVHPIKVTVCESKANKKGISFSCTITPSAVVNGRTKAQLHISQSGPGIFELSGADTPATGEFSAEDNQTSFKPTYKHIIKEINLNHKDLKNSSVKISIKGKKEDFIAIPLSCEERNKP